MTNQHIDPTFSKADSDGFSKLVVWQSKKTPSWKRYGNGSGSVELSTHAHNRYLGVCVSEYAHNENGRGGASKVAMMALNNDMAQKAFDMMWSAGFRPSSPA